MKVTNKPIVFDGQAGVGKSTIGRQIAERLNVDFIDTGAYYRGLTYLIVSQQPDWICELSPSDLQEAMSDIINSEGFTTILETSNLVQLVERSTQVLILGEDRTTELRETTVTALVPIVSTFPKIRNWVNDKIVQAANSELTVFDGRRLIPEVFDEVQINVRLSADPEVRALRRQSQFQTPNSVAEVRALLQSRDFQDSVPRVLENPPERTLQLDTSDISIEEIVDLIMNSEFLKDL